MTAEDLDAEADELILEGLVTTQSELGETNVSPMGPTVDRAVTRLRLRPFRTSRTYANLKRSGRGVFHVTDNVEMLALAAIGRLVDVPPLRDCAVHGGKILEDACRWYAFEVVSLDDSGDRSQMECRVLDQGRLRDFFGWNRAQHAVLEAAILATRIHLMPRHDMMVDLDRLEEIVRKTAGQAEARAFGTIREFVEGTPPESFAPTRR